MGKTFKIIITAVLVIGFLGVAFIIGLKYLHKKKPFVFKMPSICMEPTILKGESFGIDRLAYMDEGPKRGDVIVFRNPKDKNKRFVFRNVGLPKEEIEIRKGNIYINGEAVTLPQVPSDVYYLNKGNFGKEGQVVTIPEGKYYVLGDNSAYSLDSRYRGFIPKEDIVGKVILIRSRDGKMRQPK